MNPVTCKDWDINSIVSDNSNFFHLRRVSASSPDVDAHIKQFEEDGIPLIIEGFHHGHWPNIFDAEWLRSHGPQSLSVRNVHTRSDSIMPTDEFFKISRETSPYAVPNETARLYGKDVECPAEWNDWLHNAQVIPNKLLPKSSDNMLMNLPKSTPVETLMCYIGIGDTYTPAHKDLCASSGQNLMCYTEEDGSSIWFMTESSSTPEVDAFFNKLGNEIDHETRVLSVKDLAKAHFNVYVARQRLGDLVLVPPRSCHQVINSGGISIKMSWSRMTIRGLMAAYYHELPLYRRVCRPETYKIKSIIFYTLLQKASQLRALTEGQEHGAAIAADLASVVDLFASILVEEYSGPTPQFDPLTPVTASSEPSSFDPRCYEPKDGCLVCDFCGADIFQTYFESENCCADSPDTAQASKSDPFVLCSGCYAEGRLCKCQRMTLLQCYSFDDLHKELQDAIIVLETYQTKNRLTIDAQRFDFQRKYGISQAASVLHKLRDLSSQDGKCRFSGSEHSHAAEEASFLSCKRCHSSKCFSHVLKDYKMHSVAALIEKDYEGAYHGLIQAEKSGQRPELHHQLTRLALIHHTCKPLSTSIVPGWYDRNIELTPISAVSMVLDAVDPQPLLKTSVAPEAFTAFDLGSLSDTSTLTPVSSRASSLTPQTMQPARTPLKIGQASLRRLQDNFLGVYLPVLPERRQTRPSEGYAKKSIPVVPSKASSSPSIVMSGGVRVAKVSLKSYLRADDAGFIPTRKRSREDDGGPSNHASTSPGKVKVARTHEGKELTKRRERFRSEQSADSAFSSALAQHLEAALQRTPDDDVDEAVHESIPPPKLERRRKPKAVAQPAHKYREQPVDVHSVRDEPQEGPGVDLSTIIASSPPSAVLPAAIAAGADPTTAPTQGEILRAAAAFTMQVLWGVSGQIAQAIDSTVTSTAFPHHLMQQPMGTQAGTTGPPPPYPSNENPYTEVDRPRGVFYPPRVFGARDFAPGVDHSGGLARSARPTRRRDVHYGRDNSGASFFHKQSHPPRNWPADQQRHKDYQHGHNNYQDGNSYQHRRNNKSHWDNNNPHRYNNNDRRFNDNQHRRNDGQHWQHNNDHGNTQPRYNVHRHTGYNNQFNRRRASSIHRDNLRTHQHQSPREHLEEGLRNSDEDEMIKDTSELQEMGDSTPSRSGASAAQPFLRDDRTPGEQAWEDDYEQLDDESEQSAPQVASPRNDEDTQGRRALSPQALTLNLTHNPWN
ncbi:hypothetical protein CCMSSC00406_0005035 [Pleurotus cornucopiae]|uniref:Uncharacterized protein n=1 Tax=Pleurotus cornucopiae TaxID=5321 RepID=A0ACB7J6B2_PLECO|nr:hypothetical protein CCMSSC00406_0005035 [Pleurotus cornucopiae]